MKTDGSWKTRVIEQAQAVESRQKQAQRAKDVAQARQMLPLLEEWTGLKIPLGEVDYQPQLNVYLDGIYFTPLYDVDTDRVVGVNAWVTYCTQWVSVESNGARNADEFALLVSRTAEYARLLSR